MHPTAREWHIHSKRPRRNNAAARLSPALGPISQSHFSTHGVSSYNVPESSTLCIRTQKGARQQPYFQTLRLAETKITTQSKTEVGTKSRSSRMKQESHTA